MLYLFCYCNRLRPAEQGPQIYPVIVLGSIVYILLGLIRDAISNAANLEGLPMKTKMKKAFVAIISSIANSIWTVGANLLAGALLV